MNNPINMIDPDGRAPMPFYVTGNKTTSIKSFMSSIRAWAPVASNYVPRHSYQSPNRGLITIFDHDYRATEQIVGSLGKGSFSYVKSFGKYVDAGLPLDVAHFMKNADLAQSLPDGLVRMAGVNEEYNQAQDERPAGRTSAFSPEDLFSNELGIIFGSGVGDGDFATELETLLNETRTLFTTNSLEGGKYLNEGNISRLRGIAEKYYGTSDLRTFQKTNSIYNLDNIKKINDRAANKELPLHGG